MKSSTTPSPGYVAAGLQLVELRVDRRLRQGLRVGQVLGGDLGRVEPGCCLRHLFRERCGFLDPLVERHDGAQVARGGVFQEDGLQQRQAPVAQRLLRQSEAGGGGADLQHVDLEASQDAPLDCLLNLASVSWRLFYAEREKPPAHRSEIQHLSTKARSETVSVHGTTSVHSTG